MKKYESATEVATHRPNGGLMQAWERLADALVKGLTFETGNFTTKGGVLFHQDVALLATFPKKKGFFLHLPKDVTFAQMAWLDEVIGEVYFADDENPLPSKYEDLCLVPWGSKHVRLTVGHVSGDEFKHLLKWEIEKDALYRFCCDDAGFHLMKVDGGTVPTC